MLTAITLISGIMFLFCSIKETVTQDTELQQQLDTIANSISALEDKLDNYFAQSSQVLSSIESELNSHIQQNLETHCDGGIYHGGQCIKLAYTRGNGGTYSEALATCNNRLAEMSSDQMIKAVIQYVSAAWIEYPNYNFDRAYVWVGGTYEQSDYPKRLVTLSNGTKVELTSGWYPGGPSNDPAMTNLLIFMSRRSGEDEGLYNHKPGLDYGIPLCRLY